MSLVSAAVRLHIPPATPPSPDALTLRLVVHRRIDSLALRMQTGAFSRDHFLNSRRNLTRFIDAWCVPLPDGRLALVPRAEPHRRAKLKYGAGTAEEAIAKAIDLMGAGSGLNVAVPVDAVRTNGDRLMAETSNDDLNRWLLANPQWESGHTKTNNLLAIHDCFAWYADEYDVKSPYKRKRLPTFVKPSRREAEEREYVALMRKGCRQLRRALWAMWNVAGFRTCEMREMLWSDFDWDGGFVLTYAHKTARRTNKPRLVALTPRQLRFFSNLHKRRPAGTTHVFLNTEGSPWSRRSFALNLRRIAAKIGLDDGVAKPVSGYCFRHSFGTQADEGGLPEQDTAMLLGHEGPQMLRKVYSKASRKVRHMRGCAQRMETLRRDARKERAKERPAKKRRASTEIQGELF